MFRYSFKLTFIIHSLKKSSSFFFITYPLEVNIWVYWDNSYPPDPFLPHTPHLPYVKLAPLYCEVFNQKLWIVWQEAEKYLTWSCKVFYRKLWSVWQKAVRYLAGSCEVLTGNCELFDKKLWSVCQEAVKCLTRSCEVFDGKLGVRACLDIRKNRNNPDNTQTVEARV